MSDHVTLLGSENVRRAGRDIASAGQQISHAAANLEASMHRFMQQLAAEAYNLCEAARSSQPRVVTVPCIFKAGRDFRAQDVQFLAGPSVQLSILDYASQGEPYAAAKGDPEVGKFFAAGVRTAFIYDAQNYMTNLPGEEVARLFLSTEAAAS